MKSTQPISLDGSRLTLEEVATIARDSGGVALAPEGLERMALARKVVERHLDEGIPVYGLTTGLGNRVGHKLTRDVLSEFSVLTLRGRSNSVGPRAPVEVVRAAMVLRVNSLLTGGAGADPALAEAMVAALNAGFHPDLPMIGSIGAGDLCTMAHIGLGLMGEGKACHAGKLLPASEALRRAGLKPFVMGPKDGLAIANCSAFTVGLSALAFVDARLLVKVAQAAGALTLEGFRGNISPLDPRCTAARPAPGQDRAAKGMLAYLKGGALMEPGAARRLQDPISLRALCQINGAAMAAMDFLEAHLLPELNAAADNPVVLAEDDEIICSANFHTPGLALSLETVTQALAHLGAASASRSTKMLSGRLSGLPDNLTTHGHNRSGFAPLYKTLEALVQECRHLALPAPQEQRYGADGVEDEVNATAFSARKLNDLLPRLGYLLAAELIIAAQAIDLAEAKDKLGKEAARLHRAIRARVERLDDDRPLGPDLERLADLFSELPLLEEPLTEEKAIP